MAMAPWGSEQSGRMGNAGDAWCTMKKSYLVAEFCLVVAGVFGLPQRCEAQSCTADANCPQGTTCQAPNEIQPGVACIQGQACPAPPPLSDWSTCQPAPCKTDGNCVDHMLCETYVTTRCDGITDPSSSCPVATASSCFYRWQLPCSADGDCGTGFFCQPIVQETCTAVVTSVGSTDGVDTSDAGTSTLTTGLDAATSPDAPPGCVVTSISYPGFCESLVSACAADVDCAEGWVCMAPPPIITMRPVPVTDAGGAPSDAPAEKRCQAPASFPVLGEQLSLTGPRSAAVGKTTPGGSASGGCSIGTPDASNGPIIFVALAALLRARRRVKRV
jgi:hypothetical protein